MSILKNIFDDTCDSNASKIKKDHPTAKNIKMFNSKMFQYVILWKKNIEGSVNTFFVCCDIFVVQKFNNFIRVL